MASKGFMMALMAFIKPFEAPQRNTKIKIYIYFNLNIGKGAGRVNYGKSLLKLTFILS